MNKIFQRIKKLKNEYYIFLISIGFYSSLFFNLNNKTLLLIFFIFLSLLYLKTKNILLSLFLLYLLCLPFEKGKTYFFTLIPPELIKSSIPYDYSLNITFADLAFFGTLFFIFKEEIIHLGKSKKVSVNKTDFLVFLFLLSVFISTFFSDNRIVSFFAFLRLVRMASAYFLVRRILLEEGTSNLIILVMSAVVSFEGIFSCLQFIIQRPLGLAIETIGGPFSSYGHLAAEESSFFRAQGTFDLPITLSSFLIVLLPLLIVYAFTHKKDDLFKKIYLLSIFTGFVGLAVSASRASWGVLLIIFLGIIFFLKRNKTFYLTPLIKKWSMPIVIMFFFFIPFLIVPRIFQLYQAADDQGGVYYRTYLLEKTWFLSLQNPMGIGLATFPAVLAEKFGFFTRPAPVHNLFAEILVETGILSLIIFLLFLILSFKTFFMLIKTFKRNNHLLFTLKIGAFFGALSFLLISQFYPFLSTSQVFEYLWLFLGIMLY